MLFSLAAGVAVNSVAGEEFSYACEWQANSIGPAPFGPEQRVSGEATWVPPQRAGGLVWAVRANAAEKAWPRLFLPMCIYTARNYDTHDLWSRRIHHFFTFNTIDFGAVCPADDGPDIPPPSTPFIVAERDWTHARLDYQFEPRLDLFPAAGEQDSFSLTISRLAPAVLVESTGGVTLFAGIKEAADFPDAEFRKLKAAQMNAPYRFSYMLHGSMNVRGATGPYLPAHYALSDGNAVKIRSPKPDAAAPYEFPAETLAGLEKGWMLCWFGDDSYFYSTRHPLISTYENDVDANYYKADCPILILFSPAPDSITLEKSGQETGMRVTFTGDGGGKAAIMPLLGARLPALDETRSWSRELPPEIAARCGWWAARLAQFPVSASESYEYDNETGILTTTEQFRFVNALDRDTVLFAPAPPMLSLARRYGFPVVFDRPLVSSGMPTPIGQLEGCEGAAEYRWSTDVGRILSAGREPGTAGAEPPELAAKLRAEVEKIIEAGSLRPWPWMEKSVPDWGMPGRIMWNCPGEVLYALARAAPFLDENLLERVREYARAEREKYPPEAMDELPYGEGAFRMRHHPFHSNTIAAKPGENAFVGNRKNGLERFYFLSAYYDLTGADDLTEDWNGIKDAAAVASGFDRQDWASMGWFMKEPHRISAYGGTTRVSAVGGGAEEVNAAFAGFLGLARMARQLGPDEKDSLDQAAGMLARMAALRIAMAYYSHYMYDNNFLDTFDAPGIYGCVLLREDWNSPLCDNRQVTTLDQFGVDFTYYPDPGWALNLGAFQRITPELGRLLREHALEPTRAYFEMVARNWPDWNAAFSEMFYSHEVTYNQPEDPYNLFMLKAWTLDAGPRELRGLLDIPWMERGDLYYLVKLAETIRAFRAGQTHDRLPQKIKSANE